MIKSNGEGSGLNIGRRDGKGGGRKGEGGKKKRVVLWLHLSRRESEVGGFLAKHLRRTRG